MKRTHGIITKFTLRDEPDGEAIHRLRIEAAFSGVSMNEYLLGLIRDTSNIENWKRTNVKPEKS